MEAIELFIVVLDFNAVSVNHYKLEKEEFAKIANEITAGDIDEVVQEFINRVGHHLPAIEYMFSDEEIETINQ